MDGAIVLQGNSVSITGTGLVTITAVQIGDGFYEQALPVVQTFEIAKSRQELVDFDVPSQIRFSSKYFIVNHTVTSNLPLHYTVSGLSTVSGDTVFFTNVGIVTIDGVQLGDTNYLPSNAISKTFEIIQGIQWIDSIYATDTLTFGIAVITLAGFSNVGLPIDYTVLGANLLPPYEINAIQAGIITVSGMQTGNLLYEPTTLTTTYIFVQKAAQTILGINIPSKIKVNELVTFSGLATSGLPVLFTTFNAAVTIMGNALYAAIPQIITIAAFQVGNSNYRSSDTLLTEIDCRFSQSIVGFNSIQNQPFNNPPYSLTNVTTSSALPISYAVYGAAVLTQNSLSFTGLGPVTVTAKQIGNAQYFEADFLRQIFAVTAGNQTILGFNPIPNQVFGNPAITLTGYASSGLAVIYSISGSAYLAGNQIIVTNTGVVTISAIQNGNLIYTPAPTVSYSFSVSPATQTISGLLLPATIPFGSVLTLVGTSTANLPLSFTYAGNVLGNTNIFTVTGLGAISIIVSQAGTSTILPAQTITITTTAIKANQTIVGLATLPSKKPNDLPFSLPVFASSGLPIVYSITGPVVTNGALVTILGPGVAFISASEAGNSFYNPAIEVMSSFIIRFTQSISGFNSISQKTFGDVPITLSGISNSMLTVGYSVVGPAFIMGNLLSITGAGNVTITAYQLGDAYYLPAQSKKQIFSIKKANQTILGMSFTMDTLLGNNLFYFTSTISSGLAISFFASGNNVITSTKLFVNENGYITITGIQAGTSNYNSAIFQTILEIPKLDQRITSWSDIPILPFSTRLQELDAMASSGLATSYSISGIGKIIGNNMLSVLGVGIVTITAYQAGNELYHSAENIVKLVEVIKGEQLLSFEAPASLTISGETFITLTGITNAGLTPTYTIEANPNSIAGISNGILQLTGEGTVIVTAIHFGNNNFETSNAVIQVVRVFKSKNPLNISEIWFGKSEILIYPNPNQGTFFIDARQEFEIEVHDMLGRTIKYICIRKGTTKVDNIPSGIYFIKNTKLHLNQKVVVY